MCGVQNECSGDAPAKDGAGHARPKREHKAERHVKDGRPKRRGAEENVFHEDWTEKCMKNIFFFFSTGEKCSKLCTENKKRKDVAYETERNEA